MEPQQKKEVVIGMLVTTVFLIGVGWLFYRFNSRLGLSLSIIVVVLVILLILMKQLLPKKYRDALRELEKQEKEQRKQ